MRVVPLPPLGPCFGHSLTPLLLVIIFSKIIFRELELFRLQSEIELTYSRAKNDYDERSSKFLFMISITLLVKKFDGFDGRRAFGTLLATFFIPSNRMKDSGEVRKMEGALEQL